MNPSKLALLLGIATVANSHGIMIEPRPYNLHKAPLQQVAPLGPNLPFPCQGHTEHADNRTILTAGTTQTVKFWISAVHGGGSVSRFYLDTTFTPSKEKHSPPLHT